MLRPPQDVTKTKDVQNTTQGKHTVQKNMRLKDAKEKTHHGTGVPPMEEAY